MLIDTFAGITDQECNRCGPTDGCLFDVQRPAASAPPQSMMARRQGIQRCALHEAGGSIFECQIECISTRIWAPDPGDAPAFSQLHLLVLPAFGRRVGPLGNRCVGLDRPPRRPQLVRYRCLGRSGRSCLFARLGHTVSSRRAEASATSPRMDPMILILLPQGSWPGLDHEQRPVFFSPPQSACGNFFTLFSSLSDWGLYGFAEVRLCFGVEKGPRLRG
jgi:hypothetical protein